MPLNASFWRINAPNSGIRNFRAAEHKRQQSAERPDLAPHSPFCAQFWNANCLLVLPF